MLSELLSANLCTPFLLQMVEGKNDHEVCADSGFFSAAGREKSSETEAAVGLWTGNLVSVFFITQFFTSLLWSSIADRHGRRAVLVASLTGSAIALIAFGTSESVCARKRSGLIAAARSNMRASRPGYLWRSRRSRKQLVACPPQTH
jgi:MFS family permease